MDALSDKGVVFNLYHDVTATRFPLQRLNTDSLTILALKLLLWGTCFSVG
jgi:hypothetical protein